tara:strand:+ start:4544 stop:4783 length:240 start_codon:yes stop_codon:yes gene_type:complete
MSTNNQFIGEYFTIVKKLKPQHIQSCIDRDKKTTKVREVGFYNTISKQWIIYDVDKLTKSSMKELRKFLEQENIKEVSN